MGKYPRSGILARLHDPYPAALRFTLHYTLRKYGAVSEQLHLGNRSRDEASLVAYLIMTQSKIPFERVVHLDGASETPWLEDGGRTIRGPLAIADHIAARCPPHALWPARDQEARALAEQALTSFAALRAAYPFNPALASTPNPAAKAELLKLDQLWSQLRKDRPDSSFLFGEFGVVDAAFAPLVLRVVHCRLELSASARAYAANVYALPAIARWTRAALEDQG